jgi:hypothetical protein
VAYDWLVTTGHARLVGEPHPDPSAGDGPSELERAVAVAADPQHPDSPLGALVLAAWRAALIRAAATTADATATRDALARLLDSGAVPRLP